MALPDADNFELVGVEIWGEAVDLGEIEAVGLSRCQMGPAEEFIVVGLEIVDIRIETALANGARTRAVCSEDQFLAGSFDGGRQCGQRRVQVSGARIGAATAEDDVADQLE